MATRPEIKIKDLLDADSNVTSTVYQGAVVPEPDDAVFLIASGGPSPDSFFNDPEQWHQKRVQIRLRNTSYGDGRDQAGYIYDAVRNAQPSGTVVVRVENSDFSYIGRDDKSRHEWSLNVTVHVIE